MGFGARDLISKNDTNIIGSIVAGNKVIADIGGDLNIQTLQERERSKSSDVSFGGSVTIGVGVSASVYGGYNSSDSDYISAKNQAGILAGDQGFDINVKGNTSLIGAAISSTQTAIDKNLNQLTTGTLTTLDLENSANYDASSMGMSVGFSKGGSNKVDANTGNLSANGTGTASSWGNLNSARPSFMTASDSSNSQTKSGISAGNITITNAENQAKLTGKTPEEMLALLNRDVLTGWDKTNALDKIYDEASINASFEITNQLNTEVGIYQANRAAERAKNEKTIKDLEEKAKSGALSDAQIAELNKAKASLQSSEKWAMGGTSTLALNAISLAANGNVTGSAADLIRDSAVNYLQGLAAQEIKKLGDQFGEAARTALHAIASCAGAAAKQGSCSSAALAGGASVVLNIALDNLLKINSKDMDSLEKDARVNLITSLIAGITQAAGGDAALANAASRIEMENNQLAFDRYVQQKIPGAGPITRAALIGAGITTIVKINGVKYFVDEGGLIQPLPGFGESGYDKNNDPLQGFGADKLPEYVISTGGFTPESPDLKNPGFNEGGSGVNIPNNTGGNASSVDTGGNIVANTNGEEKPSNINWTPHGFKHYPPKNTPWNDIVKTTQSGPAKYKPEINIESLERSIFETGQVVTNGKPWKLQDVGEIIGASEGKPSQWVRVESSGGTIHGHPISQKEYLKLTKNN